MGSNDTVNLLRECDGGAKMAISSMDDILEKVQDVKLKKILTESKSHHKKLELEIEELLNLYEKPSKEPNAIAKGMSWMKTNMKLAMDASDETIADLIIDGCDMGVKSLNRYFNQYTMANEKAQTLCKELISIEEELSKSLRPYL